MMDTVWSQNGRANVINGRSVHTVQLEERGFIPSHCRMRQRRLLLVSCKTLNGAGAVLGLVRRHRALLLGVLVAMTARTVSPPVMFRKSGRLIEDTEDTKTVYSVHFEQFLFGESPTSSSWPG